VTYLPGEGRFYCFIRDITARKNIEKQLRLASFSMSNISDAVYWIASDSSFLDVNEAACRMRGYTHEEILTMRVADIDPNYPVEAWPEFWNTLKQQGSLTLETNHRTRNGLDVDVEVKANYFSYLDTEYNCAVVRDITERKGAERDLKTSEEALRSLMELMPVGVAWSDKDGNIEYANQYFQDKFGYKLPEIPTLEKWFLNAYPDTSYREDLKSSWISEISENQTSGRPIQPRDVKITCKDGTIRHAIVNTQVLQQRTLAIFTDITERESLQEELIKKQKLESIGVLAGGIAHDFNNILTAILGNISYAIMLIGQDHKAFEPLQQSEKAAKRAAELSLQLLTFSKGGRPVTCELDPGQLLKESLSLVMPGSNVNTHIQTNDELRTIEADAGQISQAFNNLIINAIQAMPGGGTIKIRADNATLNDSNLFELPGGDYVCGIPAENLMNIYDPYFTTKADGSGLGLASVQSIISKHRGHISVRSAVGRGTVFEILLPAGGRLPLVQHANTSVEDDVCVSHPDMSILVMDDEEMIREMAAMMLKDLGYHVVVCANGEEAVALYKATFEAEVPFSAAIMDLTIPGGMGGREAAGAIRRIDPQARLIVSSGYSNDPIMADYRKYGFEAIMLKPYGVEELSRALSTLFRPGKSPA